ncbi:MAG: hypothetical protein HZB41_13435 [Ignavibacteriae bacterium]|nr:hypothetical protein [Ignavibacteriota bacterium]
MLRQNAVKIFIVILGIISTCYISYSQTNVTVPDTVIPRGEVYSIPINGSLDQVNKKSIKIKLRYNARVIYIKSVKGSDNTIMNCLTPKLGNPDYSDISKTTVEISCDSISSSNSGIFCFIDVEGLAGPDTLTYLVPVAIYINDVQDSTAVFDGGQIKVPGDLVYQRFPEGIGQNYPNPFASYTFFPVVIDKLTKVNFKLYTNNGSEVSSINNKSETLELYKKTGTGEVKVNFDDEILDRGNYVLHFIPDAEFANGSYFLVMKTVNGIYNIRFLYIK